MGAARQEALSPAGDGRPDRLAVGRAPFVAHETTMTHVLEINIFDTDGSIDDTRTRSFKTLSGATSAGIRELGKLHGRRFYGYQAADRWEGPDGRKLHVVAEWYDTRHGKRTLLAKVWR